MRCVKANEGQTVPDEPSSFQCRDMLLHEARTLGVHFALECEVTEIKKNGAEFSVHSKEQKQTFDACVIATGSVAMPTLGSSGSGYGFAKALGHSVIEPYPSLVQFICDEPHLKEASGVKMDASVELYIANQKCQRVQGDLLFTASGLQACHF